MAESGHDTTGLVDQMSHEATGRVAEIGHEATSHQPAPGELPGRAHRGCDSGSGWGSVPTGTERVRLAARSVVGQSRVTRVWSRLATRPGRVPDGPGAGVAAGGTSPQQPASVTQERTQQRGSHLDPPFDGLVSSSRSGIDPQSTCSGFLVLHAGPTGARQWPQRITLASRSICWLASR